MPGAVSSTRGLVAAFSSTFFELVGFFMLLPLLQLTLTARGVGASGVGLFTALDWLGIFIVTPLAGRLARFLGERRSFWLSGALPLVCALGFVLTDAIWWWSVLFFVAGMASGLRWIVGEALVAQCAPERYRGRIVGLFQTMIGVTFMIGPGVLVLVGTQGTQPFVVVIALLALGVACSLALPATMRSATDEDHVPHAGVRTALRAAPSVMAAGFVGGLFEVGLTGLLPVLGLSIGFDNAAATLLITVSGIGSAVLMLPAGALADRFDRNRIAVVLTVLLLASSLVSAALPDWPWLAWPLVFVWGGLGGALYTIAMVSLGMRFRGPALVDRAAVLVMTYTLGGILAPPLGGLALDYAPRWGFTALFTLIAGLGLVLLLGALRREARGNGGAA